jgi:hypothetical protein
MSCDEERSHLGKVLASYDSLLERATGGSNAKLKVAQAELGTLLLKIVVRSYIVRRRLVR